MNRMRNSILVFGVLLLACCAVLPQCHFHLRDQTPIERTDSADLTKSRYLAEILMDTGQINQRDSNGKKDGQWITIKPTSAGTSAIISIEFYKSGLRDGLAHSYEMKPDGTFFLQSIGMYRNGVETGQWQYYCYFPDSTYRLCGMIDSISANTRFGQEAKMVYGDACDLDSTRQCYHWEYDEKGRIIEEGWYIFYIDPQGIVGIDPLIGVKVKEYFYNPEDSFYRDRCHILKHQHSD